MHETQFGKGATDQPEDFQKPTAFQSAEIAGAFSPAVWIEKDPHTGFVTYPKRNQGVQSSCVTYVLAKQIAIDELQEHGVWREFSPRSIYPYVAQKGGGSNSVDASNLVAKLGMTLEFLLPTDHLTEAEATKDTGYVGDAKQVALIYKPQQIFQSASDFETIASILYAHQQQGIKKGVAVTIVGTNNGTWLTMYPTPPIKGSSQVLWAHRILVTDFGLIGGKKYLSFDNSWGENPGNKGQQFLGEDYQPFVYGAIYTLNLADDWQSYIASTVPMPKHTWSVDLSFGSVGDDVTALQTALQSLGMFPVSKIIKPTGNFLGLTQNCVKIFQQALALPVTGTVDETTRAKLNSIFGG